MKGKRILVVSSDPPLLNLFQNDLPAKSYQVTHTQDTGEELKAVLNKVLPDLVVLDIMMPQLDGIEVCLRLRQWSQVPIIMLSAWGTRKGMVKAILTDFRRRVRAFDVLPFGTAMSPASLTKCSESTDCPLVCQVFSSFSLRALATEEGTI